MAAGAIRLGASSQADRRVAGISGCAFSCAFDHPSPARLSSPETLGLPKRWEQAVPAKMRRAPRQKMDGDAFDWTTRWRFLLANMRRPGNGKRVKRRLNRALGRQAIETDDG